MLPLKIFCFLLMVWSTTSTPLKAAPPARSRTPVYFPIDAGEFKNFGIRLPSGAAKSLSRGRSELPPSTTPKPTTTTMRLPIAQKSHVAPPAVVTSSPLAYLTDSSYYIPSRTTEFPGSSLGHQLLSGSPIFDDDDLANRYLAVHSSAELMQAEQDRADAADSSHAEKELETEEEQQEVLSQDSSLEDQERYGLFFIGEEESFGGSEEHFEQVSYPDSFAPPQGDYRESEDRGAVLQSLPEARPSSLYFDPIVSINEPVYRAPSRTSSRYASPEEISPVPSYAPPSAERSYRPPATEKTTSTTERAYRPPTTTERAYRPPTTTERAYPPSTERSYTPPTTKRPYRQPATTERPYRPPTTAGSFYRPSTTTERPYTPPTSTERSYRQSITTEKTYRAQSSGTRTRRPSSSRIHSPPTTERTYQPPPTERTHRTTTENKNRPRLPARKRVYQPPTTERSYRLLSTIEDPYQAPRTQARYRVTSTSPAYSQPTTERAYRLRQPSVEEDEQDGAPSRSYTPIRNRYTPPTTSQRPYTPARRTTVKKSTPAPTTTQKPYRQTIETPSTTERSYGTMKLVSVRKYTGAPPVQSSTAKPYPKRTGSSKVRGTGRPRTRYVAPLRTSTNSQSADDEKSSHSVYFKPKTQAQNEETGFGSKLADSNEKASSDSHSLARQLTIQSTYSAPKNLTVKSVSVASSTSVSKRRRKPASSRSSSTYKFPLKDTFSETKTSSPVRAKNLASRAGSKYEPPVYRTSTKAFRAPSALYQGDGKSTTDVQAPLQQNFIQAADNIYVPEEYDESAIPGEAGRDYPVYSQVPDTDFQCEAQQHPGLYADTSAQCQVFHICQESGRHDSFLCPNGTVFNQQYFVCDWWYNFSCDSAASFFGLNEFIYELPEDNYRP